MLWPHNEAAGSLQMDVTCLYTNICDDAVDATLTIVSHGEAT